MREVTDKTKGRPNERLSTKEKDGNSYSYKNAMCGSFSFYRTVSSSTTEDIVPERISSSYIGKMPQERYVDFKTEYEIKIGDIISKIADRPIRKIMLCDGHRSLWNYIENVS